jgi:hypothetical protein
MNAGTSMFFFKNSHFLYPHMILAYFALQFMSNQIKLAYDAQLHTSSCILGFSCHHFSAGICIVNAVEMLRDSPDN